QWLYSYNTCDIGTMANQIKDRLLLTAIFDRDPYNNDVLSFLPGQCLFHCTCSGKSYIGLIHFDKIYVGRLAPKIDMFEAKVYDPLIGIVSQLVQMGPFNYGYYWLNSIDNYDISNSTVTELDLYISDAY
ncbi:glycoside hydrolase family 16 protein, partial [Heterobasidion irregulare TC 32-1]